MKTELYIFDMGGVVVRNFDVFPLIYEFLQVSREKFGSLSEDKFGLVSDGNLSETEFWRFFSKNYGSEVKPDLFKIYFQPEVKPEVIAKISELKKQARVVCGTNTIDSHYRCHLERGDYDIFDQVYASNKIGISKPNPDFFNYILEREKVHPTACCFIDDSMENISTAKALGLKTVLFTGSEVLTDLEY